MLICDTPRAVPISRRYNGKEMTIPLKQKQLQAGIHEEGRRLKQFLSTKRMHRCSGRHPTGPHSLGQVWIDGKLVPYGLDDIDRQRISMVYGYRFERHRRTTGQGDEMEIRNLALWVADNRL